MVSTHWGLSELTARDQARLLPQDRPARPRAASRLRARASSRTIVASQRWGIAPVAPKGWQLFFKGGWLPRSDGWVLNQVALLKRGERRISIAILTRGNPSEAYGQRDRPRHRRDGSSAA